jgi:hypothetical protein
VDQINEIVALDTEVRRGSGKRRGSNSSGVSSSKHVPPTREQLREDVEGVLQPLRDMKATWRRQVQPEVLPQELLCQVCGP